MDIQEFWSWPGLKRYLENTGRLAEFNDTITELEKLPVKDRKIFLKVDNKDVCLQVFIDNDTLTQ